MAQLYIYIHIYIYVYIYKSVCVSLNHFMAFPMALVVKNLPANAGDAGDPGSIPGSGRSPGGGHDNPLQYSCLENPVNRGAWRATVHGVSKESDTGKATKRARTHTHTSMQTEKLKCTFWPTQYILFQIVFPYVK